MNCSSYSKNAMVLKVRGYTRFLTHSIFYDYNKTEMYNITKDKRGLTTSYYIDPNGCEAQKSVVMPAGEAAFYLCYNLKFHGTLYQKFGNEYYPVFSDEFYDHLK